MRQNDMINTGSGIPLGVAKIGGAVQFSISAAGKKGLFLNVRADSGEEIRIDMKDHHVLGDVYSVRIEKLHADYIEYDYDDGAAGVRDDYAGYIADASKWGEPARRMTYGFFMHPFRWRDDRHPYIPLHELVIYKLHVRGFTMSPTSGVRHRGTFKGVTEKIRHLKDLGINCVLLMPVTDFPEMVLKMPELMKADQLTEHKLTDYQMNYWGYGESYFFAPKASYAAGSSPEREFKEMVQSFHREGMEVVMEMNFPSGTSGQLMLDALRYWVVHYHVDGFQLNSNVSPIRMISEDPYLKRTKIFSEHFDLGASDSVALNEMKHLAVLHDGYLNCARRFLKGDDDMVRAFWRENLQNDTRVASVRYLAGHNGLRLADMVCYDEKHNEANGEHGSDGTDYNYSWNCGAEGDSKKRSVRTLRKSQLYNAVIMAVFHQGIPMIYAGDEFLHSQGGNNNPYCLDNEITWIDWKNKRRNKAFYDFLKSMLALRAAHPVLHMEKPLRMMDYLRCGYPDVSLHGAHPWRMEDTPASHYLGLMYCGRYAHDEGKDDDFFYFAYNMHWEPKEIGLPTLPRGMVWEIITSSRPATLTQIPARTIVIFKSRRGED